MTTNRFLTTVLEKDRRQMRRARQNKPKRLKTLVINKIARKAEKQTQACYEPWYQSLTAILAPILKKFVWIASCPIADSGLWPRAGRRPSLGGLTTKATMSFRMNRMSFDTARYCGLGRSQRGRGTPPGFRARQVLKPARRPKRDTRKSQPGGPGLARSRSEPLPQTPRRRRSAPG